MNKIILINELKKPDYLELVEAQNYPAIADLLNSQPLIPNLEPQRSIPKPITLIELFECITPAEALSIANLPGILDRIERTTKENDRVGLQTLFMILQGLLTQESQQKIQILIQQTIPDPKYQEQIPGASRAEELGIFPITNEDIQAVLNG